MCEDSGAIVYCTRTYCTVLHAPAQVLNVKCGEGHSMLLLESFPKPKTDALVTWGWLCFCQVGAHMVKRLHARLALTPCREFLHTRE